MNPNDRIPLCSDSEESLNIEMVGDPDAWNGDAPPKGGGGNLQAALLAEKLNKKLDVHQKFITKLIEEPNRGVFQCLIANWVNKKKIMEMVKRQQKADKLKAKKRREAKKALVRI